MLTVTNFLDLGQSLVQPVDMHVTDLISKNTLLQLLLQTNLQVLARDSSQLPTLGLWSPL